ncbi:methyl-accepting chemotaxis protein signaling domain protein [Leptospira kirschneri str. 200801925]|uniref:Methyl-accepting chemotaxis protein signaling domain protein n=1 Tax=Leptospira kirschneri str. 200802841 TaxID=1193047 RepID=A0A828Y6N1_9LEPT|nr:methyl-accepting chemotaxis protein [Leptospira kirschneri]EMO76944.1 methyl-accepting chemotaxis protein signaling domain protein [Leptospira kirschneri str. 200801925]EKO50818.1 methyl-accepting chemotaxis protein signaling domain protein [Leptospira kirschneri str. 200802841]EKP06740.1 methyl-accepting chemotaxis protein signaling domain protein [Leptospira kirschneri str. 2008720114]EMK18825.1 methyl-accepting chemotaxis protein signaling domain protein [Leptospira kirschneri serovar Bim
MNQFESKKLRWKLTIGLELLTSILAVPLAVLFVISAGGYDFNQSIGLIISSTISLTTSFVVPSVRFVILGKLLKNLEDKNWFVLNSKEKSEIKIKILNFPLYNSWFYMIQWSYGIFAAWRIMHLFFVPKTIESLPFAFLPAIIYPVLGVSHFFLTESTLVALLESDRLGDVYTDPEKIKTVGIHTRIFSTISAIAILPIVILGYLLFEETSGWIKLGDVTIPLILTLMFMLIAVGVASFQLSYTIRRNSENMIQIFAKMSDGNLTQVLPTVSSDELGSNTRALSDFVKRLRIIVKRVSKEAIKLSESSKTLGENTSELSRKMEDQAASSEEMSSAVEEISASIHSTASRAESQTLIAKKAQTSLAELEGRIRQVHSALVETKADADRMKGETKSGEEALKGTQKAMEAIDESTTKMGATVNVIREITDRIGLLSLNASIEAARAGEAGKGFAVVAQEIAKLGEQTQENAKRITSAISEALNATKSGREVIESMQTVFQRIGNTVGTTLDRISEVALLSDSQLTASDQVKSAFTEFSISSDEIRNHTQEQARTSEEFSKTIVSISETTEFLNSVVTQIDELSIRLNEQADKLKSEMDFFET